MKLSASTALLESLNKHHLMLLYDDISDRNVAEAECIAEALSKGQFCVYASIDMHDRDLLAGFASKIPDCGRHIERGDLVITDFQPFYEAALAGSLDLFEQLRNKIEERLATRASLGQNIRTLIVADAACHLVRNRHFGEASRLETWWQKTYAGWMDKGLDISIICSHPALVLKENAHVQDAIEISHEHSLVLDVKDFAMPKKPPDQKLLHVLVAEPEEDMHEVYRWAFDELPIRAQIVKSGRQCFDAIVSKSKLAASAASPFDVVIVDSHLPEACSSNDNGLELVQRILRMFPNQRVVITTTNEELLRSDLDAMPAPQSAKISLLPKPFEFSKLLALLKPAAR